MSPDRGGVKRWMPLVRGARIGPLVRHLERMVGCSPQRTPELTEAAFVQAKRRQVDQFLAFLVVILLVGLLGTFVAVNVYRCRTDDLFIHLRYAEMLGQGHGFRFNPGEHPVEGTSSLFYTIVLALLLRLIPADPLLLANGLALASLLGTGALLFGLLRPVVKNSLALATTAFLFFTNKNILHSLLEMESTFIAFFLVLTVSLYTRQVRTPFFPRLPLWPLAAVVSVATRAESLFLVLGILVTSAIVTSKERVNNASRRHPREWLSDTHVAGAILVGTMLLLFFAWKISYFPRLETPPSLLKSVPAWMRTEKAVVWTGFAMFVRSNLDVAAGVIVFVLVGTRFTSKVEGLAPSITVPTLVFTGMNQVFHSYFYAFDLRYANFSLALLFLLVGLGLWRVWERLPTRALRLVLIAVCLAWGVRNYIVSQRNYRTYAELESFPYRQVGLFLQRASCKGATVASSEAGAPAYYSQRRFFDLWGFNDYITAGFWRDRNRDRSMVTLGSDVATDPRFQLFYERMFAQRASFVFLVNNEPGKVMHAHPRFQEEYHPVWKQPIPGLPDGFGQVFARKNDPCVLATH